MSALGINLFEEIVRLVLVVMISIWVSVSEHISPTITSPEFMVTVSALRNWLVDSHKPTAAINVMNAFEWFILFAIYTMIIEAILRLQNFYCEYLQLVNQVVP